MADEGKWKDDPLQLSGTQEEIAEEFGVFRTMTERDFYTYHLFQKAKKEKKEKENERKNRK